MIKFWNKKLRYRPGTARRTVTVKTMLIVAQMLVELHFLSPALGEWPSRSSRSLEMAWIDRPYDTSYWWYVVTMCLISRNFFDTTTFRVYVTACMAPNLE